MVGKRLIDVNEPIDAFKRYAKWHPNATWNAFGIEEVLNTAKVIDVVSREQYEDLREAFVDFVCSGVNNPAPYCTNRCDKCVNSYGYCTYEKCRGFNPDGRIYDY